MKIALVSEYVSKAGGISRYVAELSERLSKTEEVHIFAKKWRDIDPRNLKMHRISGVTVFRMNLLYLLGLAAK